jgi:hypothetical protein
LSKEAAMQQFKYRITKHPAETFNDLVYYCTESGECTVDQIPHDQTDMLQDILNEEGSDGWELVQVSFGKQGIIAFWKKGLTV